MKPFKRWGFYEVGRSSTRNWHVLISTKGGFQFYDLHFYDHPRPVGVPLPTHRSTNRSTVLHG